VLALFALINQFDRHSNFSSIFIDSFFLTDEAISIIDGTDRSPIRTDQREYIKTLRHPLKIENWNLS
jgi:hypothetical protein